MRRLHIIKPPTGWPSFVTELAIVVLGVFIALAAQEAVNSWNARSELAEFRQAVDRELAQNLAAYEQRTLQSPCVNARLVQLEDWQRSWRDGSGPTMLGRIRRPIAYTVGQDVWTSGVATNLMEMPLEQRLAYASLYAAFQTYENLRLREAAAWQSLYTYDGARTLSPPEVNALRGLILSARSLGWSIDNNWVELKKEAAALGIAPAPYTPNPVVRDLCMPIDYSNALAPNPQAPAGTGAKS